MQNVIIFKCPNCGNTEKFLVRIEADMKISGDGRFIYGTDEAHEILQGSVMECCACGHHSMTHNFYNEESK